MTGHTGAVAQVVERDLYATLGVAPTATPGEIAAAFRAHAKESHPDRHAGDPAIADHFKALTSAYAVLIRPDARAAYDRRREARVVPPKPESPLHALFKTERSARIALWSGVVLVLFGIGGVVALGSIDTGDAAKTITLWLVVAKLLVCGAIIWALGLWRIREYRQHPKRAH